MLLHVRVSKLPDGVTNPLVKWLFDGWTNLVREARFRLAMPSINVPLIEAIISNPDRTLAAAARLLMVAAPAASTSMQASVRSLLEELAVSTY